MAIRKSATKIRLRIRRDDEVILISGKDKGKTGRVVRVDPARERVYVEGLNIVKRHQRPLPGSADPGGVIEKEGPIHVSNVALVDPESGLPTRIGFREEDGVKVRFAKRSGTRI